MTYSDGYIYKGNWKNGIQEGEGEEIFPNGSVYTGMFKNNQRHGNGYIKMENGGNYGNAAFL